ncbi:hypothetical protein GCM10023196_002960 [Actinoallomurus vinaceus]|uniref:Uncharacterized protein n=1 Tax=Actinoallomurus vinaceus TaxID=1080074 RepID=A0ABP8U3D4_9ACTN
MEERRLRHHLDPVRWEYAVTLISLGTSAARGFFQINRNFGEAGMELSAGPVAVLAPDHTDAGNVKEVWPQETCA